MHVVFAQVFVHRLPALLAFGQRHGQRRVKAFHRIQRIERIDDDRLRQLVGGAGEA